MKNLSLVQIENIANDRINWTENLIFFFGMLWEKDKMVDTSIFSFSQNVFSGLLFKSCLKLGLCSKGLIS